MFDAKSVDMAAMKHDLLKNIVVVIVARVLKFYLVEDGRGDLVSILTSQDFLMGLAFVLLGFAVFHGVVNPAAKKAKLMA